MEEENTKIKKIRYLSQCYNKKGNSMTSYLGHMDVLQKTSFMLHKLVAMLLALAEEVCGFFCIAQSKL